MNPSKFILGDAYNMALGDLRMLIDLDSIQKTVTYKLENDLEMKLYDHNLYVFQVIIKRKWLFPRVWCM